MDTNEEPVRYESTGIQADKPVPPWERPGCFRLDCGPHRGTFLNWLAYPSLCLGYTSVFIHLMFFWSALHGHVGLRDAFTSPQYLELCTVGFCFAAIGAPLGLTAWVLARHDLAMMRKGFMDPRGEKSTSRARFIGVISFAVNGCWAAFCMVAVLVNH